MVLWSDHGWHLGEKQHWQKYTGWRASTRVPLMIRVPKGCSTALPHGTKAGTVYKHPVSLLSLYNTLNELCGLPAHGTDSISLVPTLKSQAQQFESALTFLDHRGSVAVSGTDWRYIRYQNGDHELYHIPTDPHEWNNLASSPQHAKHIKRLAATIPTKLAEYVPPSHDALPALEWVAHSDSSKLPKPAFDGPNYQLVFMNKTHASRKVYSLEKDGSLKFQTTIKAGQKHTLRAESGSYWIIMSMQKKQLGYFKILDRNAKAVIK
ncbi:sulfatase-like hydrolase/transferase [Rubritalea tangerina]|uniref:sulfatase-like hydrolase/transferase n=1 Tax=Rubritalea tangerina TaxID=430798 RepID=UPI0036072194